MKTVQHGSSAPWRPVLRGWITLVIVAASPWWGCGTETAAPDSGTDDVALDASELDDDAASPGLDAVVGVDAPTADADDSGAPDTMNDAAPPEDAQPSPSDTTPQDTTPQDDASELDSAAPDASAPGTACVNEQDEAAFIVMVETNWDTTMQDCAVGCFAVMACMEECIADAFGFTPPCATCWAEMMSCAFAACYDVPPGTPEAEVCADESGCWGGFESCSGTLYF